MDSRLRALLSGINYLTARLRLIHKLSAGAIHRAISNPSLVVLAKAGIHSAASRAQALWIPAFARTTGKGDFPLNLRHPPARDRRKSWPVKISSLFAQHEVHNQCRWPSLPLSTQLFRTAVRLRGNDGREIGGCNHALPSSTVWNDQHPCHATGAARATAMFPGQVAPTCARNVGGTDKHSSPSVQISSLRGNTGNNSPNPLDKKIGYRVDT